MNEEQHQITVNERAFNRLTRARRENESISDVIVRLSAATLEGLQRRGELEVVTSDDKKLTVSVDQGKCLGAMSCVTMAPAIFAYDSTEKGLWRKREEPLGMQEVDEGEVDSESLVLAAESCPYQAITVRDSKTGQILKP